MRSDLLTEKLDAKVTIFTPMAHCPTEKRSPLAQIVKPKRGDLLSVGLWSCGELNPGPNMVAKRFLHV